MQLTANTILITGGGSGIGRALAEAFYARGNHVIIAGRRQSALDEVVAANPGMAALPLDIESPAAIKSFAAAAIEKFPALNVVINNAGIMRQENLRAETIDLDTAEATITTNLLGPIRLTAALLPHLQRQPHSAIVTVSSGLAFVPRADTPTYCATKAAIHSYSLSLRHQLEGSATEILEIIPPYVQTQLMGDRQASDPAAMPLADFIAEVMALLEHPPASGEIVVERCKPLRNAEKNGNLAEIFARLNAQH
jgi:uncharacterized oxidoreductase